MKNKCSCQGCDKRYVGCHAKCEDYKKFREGIDKKREAKVSISEYDNEFLGYMKSRKYRRAT